MRGVPGGGGGRGVGVVGVAVGPVMGAVGGGGSRRRPYATSFFQGHIPAVRRAPEVE